MARRETTITIEAEGRDQGKSFKIREMPAFQAEKWFMRVLMLLARSGAEVPPDIFSQGAAAFVAITLGSALSGLGKAPFEEVEVLMDEMFRCVEAYIAPNGTAITNSNLIKEQIEEARTILTLREAVLETHLGFSIRERLSTFRNTAMMMIDDGQNMPTSVSPSAS